jgi:hypothetical protein
METVGGTITSRSPALLCLRCRDGQRSGGRTVWTTVQCWIVSHGDPPGGHSELMIDARPDAPCPYIGTVEGDFGSVR